MPTTPLPTTRAAALAAGSQRYDTGEPSKRGHLSPRTTRGHRCIECARLADAERYGTDPGRKREAAAEWRAANPHRARANAYAWRAANLGASREAVRAARAGPACPSWSDRDACRAVYAACPPGWDVDHVIPLNGVTVCGLHVPWNLRCIPADVNRSKHNYFDPSDPDHLPSAFQALDAIFRRHPMAPLTLG